jgi:hypothetical protein
MKLLKMLIPMDTPKISEKITIIQLLITCTRAIWKVTSSELLTKQAV